MASITDPAVSHPESGQSEIPANGAANYWFQRYSKSLIFLIITLAVIGAYLATTVPISVFPETNFPRILVGVDNGVMPIDQMMVTVTRPLEEAVNSVPGLLQVRSTTSRGSAEINLMFNWNVDMFQTLQLVDSALARAQSTLPATAKITSHRLTFASFPILGYSLTSNTLSQTQLWELATYQLKPQLNRLDGVATVLVQGGREPEYHIVPEPAKLLAANVTITDILDAVRKTNTIDSPGLMEHDHQLFLGLVTSQVKNTDELGDIVIKATPGGLPIRVRDIGAVVAGEKPVYTEVTANGKPAVLLSINRQPDSNTLTVANEVHVATDQLKSTLPPGVELAPFYDQSVIVNESIKSVRDAIIIGVVLATGLMVLFLSDWGSSIVAGLVIPVTVMVTFIALKLMGESFNLMTLGGLAAAVGLVIDDAIVVVENIVLHRDAGETRLKAIHNAIQEVTVPLIGSTITPIVVFLPLLSITGVWATFFRALAVTMSVSLITSLALALSWTPNLSQFFIRERSNAKPDTSETTNSGSARDRMLEAEERSLSPRFRRVIAFYEKCLRFSLEKPLVLVVGAVVLIAVSYVSYRFLGTDLLPGMDEGGFIIDYIMPAGSSLSETNRVVTHVEQILHRVPEVESTSRRTGLQLGLATVTEANTGDVAVKLKQSRSRGIDEIMADARKQIKKEEPSLDIEFIQVLQDMIGDLTSTPQPVEIKLFAQDPQMLRTWAPKVEEEIKKVKGVVDTLNGIDNTISGPATVFQVNPSIAARAGFTSEEIQLDAGAVLQGQPALTPVIVNDRTYTIRVRYPDSSRGSLEAIQNTLINSSTGRTATLASLGTVTSLPGETEIRRENLQRNVSVTARLENIDLGTAIAAVQQKIAGLHLPAGIRVVYGGTFQEQQKSFHDFAFVFLLAIVLVFTVLLFEFRSFAAPAAILASALLSTSGVVLALFITRITFNISSFMGLIMVIGIVAKNGILLLDADERFRAMGFSAEDAMLQAGRRRLRPIVMTALATIAGMLPLALALGAGSQMLQPLAVSVIGGIMISMVLSLIVTPTVHFYLTRERSSTSA